MQLYSLTPALDGGGQSTPRPGRSTPRKYPVPTVQEAGWAPGQIWTGAENLAPAGIRSRLMGWGCTAEGRERVIISSLHALKLLPTSLPSLPPQLNISSGPSLQKAREHTQTHHTRQSSSGRVNSPTKRPVPDNTQHSQQTHIHAPGGIRTRNPNKRAAADPCLTLRNQWDQHQINTILKFIQHKENESKLRLPFTVFNCETHGEYEHAETVMNPIPNMRR